MREFTAVNWMERGTGDKLSSFNAYDLYRDLKKGEDDNPTLGIILCTEKDETIIKYSILAENEQLFATKYRLYLPKEEELKQLIEQDRINFELDNA